MNQHLKRLWWLPRRYNDTWITSFWLATEDTLFLKKGDVLGCRRFRKYHTIQF